MKISKVKHLRSAVGLEKRGGKEQEGKGILYYDPAKTENNKDRNEILENHCILDPDKHVKAHYRASMILYSVLNQNAKIYEDDRQKIVDEIIKNFNKCFYRSSKDGKRGIFGNKDCDLKDIESIISECFFSSIKKICDYLSSNDQLLSEDMSELLDNTNYVQLARVIVDKALRKTLRRKIKWPVNDPEGKSYDLSDIAARLIQWIVIENLSAGKKRDLWKQGKGTVTKKELLAFVGYVSLDRRGAVRTENQGKGNAASKTRAEKIAESIRKQNTKVQVVEHEGKKRLMLSNSRHPKKRFLADFIKRFANLELKDQKEELKRLKQLLTVYVYGEVCDEIYGKDIALPKDPYARLEDAEPGEEMILFSGIDEELFEQIKAENERGKDKDKRNLRSLQLQFDGQVRSALYKHYKFAVSWIAKKHDIDISDYEKRKIFCSSNGNPEGMEAGMMAAREDLYWIRMFGDHLEEFLYRKNKRRKENYQCSRLVDRIWNEWLSFVCMKYIDLGKAVYHFVLPDLHELDGKEVCLGEVLPEFEEGLTSFDYEMIKAEESLTRDIATSVTFAVNTFANAVVRKDYRFVPKKEDILEYKIQELEISDMMDSAVLKIDAVKNVLQYFGGMSRWEELEKAFHGLWENRLGEGEYALDVSSFWRHFLFSFKSFLAEIRNSSFHFSTKAQSSEQGSISKDTKVAMYFFHQEYGQMKRLIGEKYFSNNVLAFYKEESVYSLIRQLYSNASVREAQVPAFNTVVKRNDIESFLLGMTDLDTPLIRKEKQSVLQGAEDMKKIYLSSIYFVLKEIYYYGFLQQKDLMEGFQKNFFAYKKSIDAKSDKNPNDKELKNEKQALRSFDARMRDLRSVYPKLTFGQFCQQIMTDYNMQNQNRKKILSNKAEKEQTKQGNEPVYQHFSMILHLMTARTFRKYLLNARNGKKENPYAFLWNPVYDPEFMKNKEDGKVRLEKFIGHPDMPEISMYRDLFEDIGDTGLLAWYMTAHFMTGKQINLLLGDFRSYKQYISKVDERAGNTGNQHKKKSVNVKERAGYCDRVITVLEFVQQFTGRISRNINDYFENEEEYAKHLLKFLDYSEYLADIPDDSIGEDGKGKYASALINFCSTKMKDADSTDQSLGLYYDAMHMILNKNVAYSKMYGDIEMLSVCIGSPDRWWEEHWDEYAGGDDLSRTDLRVTSGDIAAYYRKKRELSNVFRTVGFIEKEQPKQVKEFQNLKNRIELLDIQTYTEMVNDIMAQMISWAYLRERDLLYFQLGYHYIRLFWGNEKVTKPQYQSLVYSQTKGDKGLRIHIKEGALLYQIAAMYDFHLPIFEVKDGEVINAAQDTTAGVSIMKFVDSYTEETYNAGLDFFGEEKRRDSFAVLRNDIAHMKYYSHHEKSIMELFAEMYNGFLQYDIKLKKSVSYISSNILERYFVVLRTHMYHKDENGEFRFEIADLESDQFTYKYRKHQKEKWKKTEVDARDAVFLEIVRRILQYKK